MVEYDKTKSLGKNIKRWIQDLVAYLTYDRNWTWLDLLISSLCTLEVYIPLIKDTNLKHYIDCADTVFVSAGQKESYAAGFIPKNTMYCDGCIYKTHSRIADFFYGYQCSCFCYYLNRGDFSFVKHTDELWDDCKACGLYEFEDEDEEETGKTN